MRTFLFADTDFPDRLLAALAVRGEVLGPRLADDGVCRLSPVRRWGDLAATLPLLPAKKALLPPSDLLWTWSGDGPFAPPPTPAPRSLVGLFPCDLEALTYLDRVFAEDTVYQARRRTLLTVGTRCIPTDDCFCPPFQETLSCDLFLSGDRVWAGSPAGEELLRRFSDLEEQADEALPPVEARGPGVPADLEERFRCAAGWSGWRQTGERCLSCGACAAVCPTCYCFAIRDEVGLDGRIARLREWDNCFFRQHALVAGGLNFRPDRGERLRFRFEHKMLGFGPLRGRSSCVGCGRCRRACPVDIDMAEVLEELTGRSER